MDSQSRYRFILVLGRNSLADGVTAALHQEGYRARRGDWPDPTAPARFRAWALKDAAVFDPARTPVLILADPPEAPALVAALVVSTREAARLRSEGQPAGGKAGRPGQPRPIQRLILMHPRDPAPALPVLEPDDPLRIETFAIEDRAARALLRRWPLHLGLDPGFGQIPHLLILGFAPPARALLLEALRLAHYGQGRARISLACDRHLAIAAEFRAAYPQADSIADLSFTPLSELSGLLGTQREPGLDSSPLAMPPVTLVAVCLEQDQVTGGDQPDHPGLALARHLVQELASSQGVSPLVLLEVGAALPMPATEGWDGQIIPIAYHHEACRPALLIDGSGDELARIIHERYRDTLAAQGRDPSDEPASQPWERLEDSYRQASRHQADHFWVKLAVTDCRAVMDDRVKALVLSPPEVERLAIVEHERWAADRYLDGWSFGPVRDNARKIHPQLIPYADLSEPMKDLDRSAVLGLPTLAERLGLGIQRLLILGIQASGPACPVGRPLQSLVVALGQELRRRYPDRALVLAATLADPRERALVRELLQGYEGASLFLLLPHPLPHLLGRLTSTADRRDFLDLLARAERRISLRGEGELAAWFARRVEFRLVLGKTGDGESGGEGGLARLAAGPDRRILLDPDGAGLTWTLDD